MVLLNTFYFPSLMDTHLLSILPLPYLGVVQLFQALICP